MQCIHIEYSVSHLEYLHTLAIENKEEEKLKIPQNVNKVEALYTQFLSCTRFCFVAMMEENVEN